MPGPHSGRTFSDDGRERRLADSDGGKSAYYESDRYNP